jgi:hypothetical protein
MIMFTIAHGQQEAAHVAEAMAQLNKESDRSAAIVAGAIVEYALEASIKRQLHQHPKITDELFRTTGPLGAYATKIDVGLLIGLYSAETHRNLVTMKNIRNAFAHRLSISDFQSQKIRAWCENLTLAEKHTAEALGSSTKPPTWAIGCIDRDEALADPRQRYILTAQVLTMGLAISAKTRMPNPLF